MWNPPNLREQLKTQSALLEIRSMKPSVQLSGDGSLAEEPKRTVGEKLRQACGVAVTAIANYTANWEGRSLPISKEIERRKWSYSAEIQ
ncbi:hypothetical protein I3842_07G108100 [Carya illinoinensis]|uniref:Uncharacterized protein n=1 Tax=Carya illinoinensis TaxID=32201 RepID=A0A922ELM4_CARIL|nr:hypothetical protein I3842_07G108100 [Carya illinoinensis]